METLLLLFYFLIKNSFFFLGKENNLKKEKGFLYFFALFPMKKVQTVLNKTIALNLFTRDRHPFLLKRNFLRIGDNRKSFQRCFSMVDGVTN